jgi:hypothetical protein
VLLTSRRAGPGLASTSLESHRGFERIARLQRALESLPSVDGARVRSLATLLDPDPTLAIVDIEPFLDHVPSPLADDPAWTARLREFPLTRGLFLSTSGAAAAFTVPVAAGHSRDEFISGGCRSAARKSRAARPAVAGADHGRGDRAVAVRLAANLRRRRDSAGGSRDGAALDARRDGPPRRPDHARHDDPADRVDDDGRDP